MAGLDTGRLSRTDTMGVAAALFEQGRPFLLSAKSDIRNAMCSKWDELLSPGGPLEALLRSVMREELAAFEARQPSQRNLGEAISKNVVAGVKHVVKTTSRTRTVEEMGRTALQNVVCNALDIEGVRQVHGAMLNLRVIANGKDPASQGDGITISFPAHSKKPDTYANREFMKLLQCIMAKVYSNMASIEEDKRPDVFRQKVALLTRHLDRVDDALEAVLRNILNNGRSDARAMFYKLLGFYLRMKDASIEMEHPTATAPALGSGRLSDFFSVVCELQATATGGMPADEAAAPAHEGSTDALSGVHSVVRKACLAVGIGRVGRLKM
ncbi:hypothetical protein I4F81_002175 [Pyropia yezoensis]|uniref:Uncharacterized protein n=1 Tax=Pyropia yezoensis TaxID=2788 RepID=A0ACC3BPB2_PYRYE|nr:hypothetical protein I4F81_002175 [Neopyropia yezoensis]